MFTVDYGKVLFFFNLVLRYADIIVHRLLAVAIGADSTYPDLMDKHKQSALCNNLNYRHKMSQYAQRASVAFHTQVNTNQNTQLCELVLFFILKLTIQNCYDHILIFFPCSCSSRAEEY